MIFLSKDFKSFVSAYFTTVAYLTYFYIISYFFNFVKNFFTLITLDIINGNLFLARGLLHSTLITKWQSHFCFLLSLDFSCIIPQFSSFVKNFFIFYGDSFLTQFIKVSGFLTTIILYMLKEFFKNILGVPFSLSPFALYFGLLLSLSTFYIIPHFS